MEMHIDHLCVCVRSVERAADHLCQLLGYHRRTRAVTNTRQKVHVLFLGRKGSLDIKLIEPSGEDSPLWSFLRSKGEGLHHLCFRTDELDRQLCELASKGLRVLAGPEPGEAFDDHRIAFGYAGFGLNLEFIDTDARRDLVEPTGRQTP